jgi:hypothetical protein
MGKLRFGLDRQKHETFALRHGTARTGGKK